MHSPLLLILLLYILTSCVFLLGQVLLKNLTSFLLLEKRLCYLGTSSLIYFLDDTYNNLQLSCVFHFYLFVTHLSQETLNCTMAQESLSHLSGAEYRDCQRLRVFWWCLLMKEWSLSKCAVRTSFFSMGPLVHILQPLCLHSDTLYGVPRNHHAITAFCFWGPTPEQPWGTQCSLLLTYRKTDGCLSDCIDCPNVLKVVYLKLWHTSPSCVIYWCLG